MIAINFGGCLSNINWRSRAAGLIRLTENTLGCNRNGDLAGWIG